MYLYVVYCLYGQCGSFLHNYWVWWCRCWVWVEMPSSRYTPATTLSSLRPAPLHCIHITRIKHHLIDFIEHAWAALLETIFIWPEKLYLWFSLKPQCNNLHRNGSPFIINRTKSELFGYQSSQMMVDGDGFAIVCHYFSFLDCDLALPCFTPSIVSRLMLRVQSWNMVPWSEVTTDEPGCGCCQWPGFRLRINQAVVVTLLQTLTINPVCQPDIS